MQSHWVLNYAAVCKILCVPLHQGHVCHFPSSRLPGFPGHCTWAHWTEKEQKHSNNQFSLLVFIIPKAISVFFLSFLVFFFMWILIEERKEEGRKKGGMERGGKERESGWAGREGKEKTEVYTDFKKNLSCDLWTSWRPILGSFFNLFGDILVLLHQHPGILFLEPLSQTHLSVPLYGRKLRPKEDMCPAWGLNWSRAETRALVSWLPVHTLSTLPHHINGNQYACLGLIFFLNF